MSEPTGKNQIRLGIVIRVFPVHKGNIWVLRILYREKKDIERNAYVQFHFLLTQLVYLFGETQERLFMK